MAAQGSLVTFTGVDPNLATAIFAKSAEQSAERTARVQAGSNERIAAIGAQSAKETTQMTTQAEVDIAEKEVEAAIKNVLAQEAGAKERTLIGAQSSEKIAETTSQAQLLSTYLTNLSNERITGMTTESNERVNTEQIQATLMKAGMDNQTAYAISQAQNLSNNQIARLSAMTQEKVAGIEATTAQTIAAGQLWSADQDRSLTLKVENMKTEANREVNNLMMKMQQDTNAQNLALKREDIAALKETQELDFRRNTVTNTFTLMAKLAAIAANSANDKAAQQQIGNLLTQVMKGTNAETAATAMEKQNTVQFLQQKLESDTVLNDLLSGIVSDNPNVVVNAPGPLSDYTKLKGVNNVVEPAKNWQSQLDSKINALLSEKTGGRLTSFNLPTNEAELAKINPNDLATAQMLLVGLTQHLKAKQQGMNLSDVEAQWVKDHQDYVTYEGIPDDTFMWIQENNPVSEWDRLIHGDVFDMGIGTPGYRATETKKKAEKLTTAAITNETLQVYQNLALKFASITSSANKVAQQKIQASRDRLGGGEGSILLRAAEAGGVDLDLLKNGDTLNYTDYNMNSLLAVIKAFLQSDMDNNQDDPLTNSIYQSLKRSK